MMHMWRINKASPVEQLASLLKPADDRYKLERCQDQIKVEKIIMWLTAKRPASYAFDYTTTARRLAIIQIPGLAH
jgi:hypothetical protein